MEKRRKGIAPNETEREEEKGRIKGKRRNDTSRFRGVWRFSRLIQSERKLGTTYRSIPWMLRDLRDGDPSTALFTARETSASMLCNLLDNWLYMVGLPQISLNAWHEGFAACQTVATSSTFTETPFCSEIVQTCDAYFEIHRVLVRSVERAIELKKSGACTPLTVSNLFMVVSTGILGC